MGRSKCDFLSRFTCEIPWENNRGSCEGGWSHVFAARRVGAVEIASSTMTFRAWPVESRGFRRESRLAKQWLTTHNQAKFIARGQYRWHCEIAYCCKCHFWQRALILPHWWDSSARTFFIPPIKSDIVPLFHCQWKGRLEATS